MHSPPYIARSGFWKLLPLFALAVVAALLSSGCGSSGQRASASSPLLHGAKGRPILAADHLASAVRLAYRFARSYARSAYLRYPPQLPGATPALSRRLAQAAARVPPSRRHLHPHVRAISLTPRGSAALHGSVEVGDGRSPPFAVGFTIEKRASGWRIVSASPPG